MVRVVDQLCELAAQQDRIVMARVAELRPMLADLWQRPADRPRDRMCPELAELLLLMAGVRGEKPFLRLFEEWLPSAPGGGDAAEPLADLLCDFGDHPDWRRMVTTFTSPLLLCAQLLASAEICDKLFEVYDAA